MTTSATLDCREKTIADIRRTLSADRDGEIEAIIVTPETETAAHALVDYCWHDAEITLSIVATLKTAA